MKRIQPLAALLLALAVGVPAQTVTPAPSMMNFQGRLAKQDGTPVSDGLYSVVISIYDAPTGGNRLWTQTFTGAITRNGVFSIPLGATNGTQGATAPTGTLNETLFATDRWLQVQLGSTSAPLLPRQLFLPVALAFKANMALTVPDGSITNIKIATGIDFGKLINVPSSLLSLPYSTPLNSSQDGFRITNNGTGGALTGFATSGTGVYGNSASGIAVLGIRRLERRIAGQQCQRSGSHWIKSIGRRHGRK